MHKKGTSAANAGVFIILTAAVLIIYILMLQPEDRQALLEGSSQYDQDFTTAKNALLDERPGRIDYVALSNRNILIPSFQIAVTEEPEILLDSSVRVTSGVFNQNPQTLRFDVEPDLANNIILSYNIEEAEGTLSIYLNGQAIFTGELQEGTPNPLKIGQNQLQNTNTLTFMVDKPGWAFWRVNEYTLSNLRVVADITDLSQSTSVQRVAISQEAYASMNGARFKYFPNCLQKGTGNLIIQVNGQKVYSGTPNCRLNNYISLGKEQLTTNNEFIFSSDKGTYTMMNMELQLDGQSQNAPTYVFDIDDRYFDNRGELKTDYDVVLRMEFSTTGVHVGDVSINGREFTFNARTATYTKSIDSLVEEGSNTLKITPRGGLSLNRLQVVLED